MFTKPLITTALAATMALTTTLPTLAAHAQTWQYQHTSIVVNSSQVSTPYRIIYDNTTYMPIYYVDTLLQQLGFTADWNGTIHTWTLSNGQSTTNLSINGKTGNTKIVVNGAVAEQNIVIVQTKDPASGVITTFMPIWYVQQILNALGFTTDTWNGAANPPTWTLSTAKAETVTQTDMVNDLLGAFAQIQSWPASIPLNNSSASSSWAPPSSTAWEGLGVVFPNAQPSQYASILGINPSNPQGTVTANQAAQWIWDWALKARVINPKYAPSTNPYTYAQDYSVFYGTSVTGLNSVLTSADAQTIAKNLVDVNKGYRQLASNKVELLLPMVSMGWPNTSNVYASGNIWQGWGSWNALITKTTNGAVNWSNFPSVYTNLLKLYDSATITLVSPEKLLYSRASNSEYALGADIQFLNASDQVTGGTDNDALEYGGKGEFQAAFAQHYPETIAGNNGSTYLPGIGGYAGINAAKQMIPVGSQWIDFYTSPFSKIIERYPSPNFDMAFYYKGTAIQGGTILGNGARSNNDYPAVVGEIG